MEWAEVKQAFKEQTPVVFNGARSTIQCARIADIGIKCESGNFYNYAAGEDRNGKCLYYGKPEQFDFPEGGALQ